MAKKLFLVKLTYKSSVICLGAIAGYALASGLPSSAALFPVTKNFWGNQTTEGTFPWAIHQSNILPGKDTIVLTTNISINDFTGGAGSDIYAAEFTDTDGVDIFGNGHFLTGDPSFININGVTYGKYHPEALRPGDVLTNQGHSFARVADNVNSIFIDALRVDGLNEFLDIGKGSSVTVRNSVLRNMTAFGKPPRAIVQSAR